MDTLLLAVNAGLLAIIAWFARDYARRIESRLADHERRIRRMEKRPPLGDPRLLTEL